ncbi:MAG: phosphoglycerate dehydrogenase [Dehalococcoidia bacterium CG2_30_46_9]|nr:MAG: phosphoglycerate dehydrogenase [Dehalococcoidia bacterium CG2_30_46_9]
MKVLVADYIPKEGLEILCSHAQVDIKPDLKPEQLKEIIADYDALIVRSKTQVSADVIELGENLKVIGRAGVGIDNIDVDVATRKGIVVVNAPTGNTISATEHTLALMLALARNIPQANNELKKGKWEREKFTGTELRNKTLGIIGLGNVGSELAKRVQAFEMHILAYDPFVSEDYAQRLKVTLVSLDRLLKEADFITLHVPLTTMTEKLIGAAELAMMKPTARIINCARGGLIDEEALLKAIQEGKIAGAAFDVFSREPLTDSPLFKEDRIVVTPHLGASTVEAQMNVARDVAEQVLTVLQGQFSRYAVNAPHIPPEMVPFVKAAATIGNLASQLTEGQVNSIQVKYGGEVANYDCNPIKTAVISGLLQPMTEEKINLVNVNLIAAQRGLKVSEEKQPAVKNYSNLITLEVNTNIKTTTVSGTVRDSETHIVQVDEFWMDIVPTGGYFLFCHHVDQPGLVGAIGTITGKADINISSMHLSRLKSRGSALMILALDESLPEKQRQEILAIPGIHTAKVVKL